MHGCGIGPYPWCTRHTIHAYIPNVCSMCVLGQAGVCLRLTFQVYTETKKTISTTPTTSSREIPAVSGHTQARRHALTRMCNAWAHAGVWARMDVHAWQLDKKGGCMHLRCKGVPRGPWVAYVQTLGDM